MENNYKFILASASPRRKELLSRFISDIEIKPVDMDETIMEEVSIDLVSMDIARRKSLKAIELGFLKEPNELLITSDTIVSFQNSEIQKIYGKPKDRAEAYNFLLELSGRSHLVNTAVVIRNMDASIYLEMNDITLVEFYELSHEMIEWYLDKNEYMDKAGAYGIQGLASIFVKSIKGNYDNIVGFPVSLFIHELIKNNLLNLKK